jgi:hypothetical protein
MPRLASTPGEDLYFRRVLQYLIKAGLSPEVEVTLRSGEKVSGLIIREQIGNGGRQAPEHHYGSFTVDTGSGQVEIDFLDVRDLVAQPAK